MLQKFLRDESGATAIEYALIATLMSIALIASIKGIAGHLQDDFEGVADGFQNSRP